MSAGQHESGSLSHVGKVRKANEDSIFVGSDHNIWVVADGVGGGKFGEVASQLAAQTVEKRCRQGGKLDEAIVEAHETIKQLSSSNEDYSGMATTVVACQLERSEDDGLEIVYSWVGDSRLYRITGTGLVQLSTDHSMAEELAARGEISAEEAKYHSCRHVLTQALGVAGLRDVIPEREALDTGDGFLLCSDGLTGVLEDEEIFDVLKSSDSAQHSCDVLVEKVLSRGAPDNVSLIVVYPDREAIGSHSDQAQQKTNLEKSSDESSPDETAQSQVQRQEETLVEQESPEPETHRKPCDKSKYQMNCAARMPLLVVVMISMAFLLLVGMN